MILLDGADIVQQNQRVRRKAVQFCGATTPRPSGIFPLPAGIVDHFAKWSGVLQSVDLNSVPVAAKGPVDAC